MTAEGDEPVVEVLGPLRLVVGGEEHRVGGRRERAVLGLLAATGDGRISAERLVDEIWGEDPPGSAAGSLQVAISRLRATLRGAGVLENQPIALGPGGYRLRGVTVDAATLSDAVRQVATLPPEPALTVAESALARWRGEPYADLTDVPTLATEATRLTEERLLLEEARAGILLRLGRPDRAAALLAPVAEAHPFRERLWQRRAVALYRCDRQADALAVLRRLRSALVDELGVDPSPATRALERAVLDHDTVLAAESGRPDPRPSRSHPPAATTSRRHPAERAERLTPTLVGRSALTARLHGLLDDAARGRGAVALLTGEAGIGKSALVADLVAYASATGVNAHVGSCHEGDAAPAYWPWLPVLRPLAGDDAPAEVTALLGGSAGSGEVVEPVVDAGSSALRVFEAVSSVLRSVGPLLVVLEDVHWADTSSLRLLAYTAEALTGAPVLLVVTARDTESRRQPALATCFAALARLGADRIRVPRLEREEVRELVGTVVDDPDAGLVEVVTERTDGNPFFALQLVRLLAARGDTSAGTAAALDVPDGVADVLRLRLLRLSAASRDTVALASVAGREVDAGVLSDALDRPALDDLDEAVRAEVLEEGDRPGSYRFVHALTRETAYADEPAGGRARRHAALGGALERRRVGNPDLVPLVAHHFAQAAGHLPELAEAAYAALVRAARDAERRGAYDEALTGWTRAAEVERRIAPADPDRRHAVLVALATARQRTGDMAGMQDALSTAIDDARDRSDWTAVARAATSFRSSGVWYWREMGYLDKHTVAALTEALEHVEDPALRARLWANLGMEYYGVWRSVEANECGERSLELARASGDPDTLLVCLSARAIALWMPGAAAQHAAAAREMLALRLGPEDEITARFHLAVALHHLNRAPEADEVMAPAFTVAADLRHTNCDVPLAWWRWMRAAETGSSTTYELGQATLALHRRTTMMSLHEGTALVVLHDLPAGADVPSDIVALGRGHPQYGVRAAVGSAVAHRGRVRDGLEIIGPLPPPEEYDYASLVAACYHAEVLALAGERDVLAELLPRIEPYADETATFGSVYSAGSTALYVGRALAALGRVEAARTTLEQALARNAEAGSTVFVERSRQSLEALASRVAGGRKTRSR